MRERTVQWQEIFVLQFPLLRDAQNARLGRAVNLGGYSLIRSFTTVLDTVRPVEGNFEIVHNSNRPDQGLV